MQEMHLDEVVKIIFSHFISLKMTGQGFEIKPSGNMNQSFIFESTRYIMTPT